MATPAVYFDDIAPGDVFTFGPYRVPRAEMLAFSQQWDPLPIHVDDAAARERGHREITASGQYTLCVKQALLNGAPWREAVIGALGFDELRFPRPVYADDALTLTIECLETRASRSKPDRGIVKLRFRLDNQDREPVLTYLDTVMFARRPTAEDTNAPAPRIPAVPEAEALSLATKLLGMKRNGVAVETRVAFVRTRLAVDDEIAARLHADFEAGASAGTRLAMGMPGGEHEADDPAFHAIVSQLAMQDVHAMMEAEQREKARKKRRQKTVVALLCLAALGGVALLFVTNL